MWSAPRDVFGGQLRTVKLREWSAFCHELLGYLRRLAVCVSPCTCCPCAGQHADDSTAKGDIQLREISSAVQVIENAETGTEQSTSFVQRLSDLRKSLAAIEKMSASAQTIKPILDQLLAVVRAYRPSPDFVKEEAEARILHLEAFLLNPDNDDVRVPGAVLDATRALVARLVVLYDDGSSTE